MVTNNTFANTFPADAANPFQQYVGEPAALRTPAEDWRRVTTQMQPFWQTRVPMSGLGDRLRARYMLSAPAMAETPGMQPTFSQYLGDYIQDPTTAPQYGAPTIQDLYARAREAAQAAAIAPNLYMTQGIEGLTAPEMRRRAWLSSQFGANAPGAAANQLRVANMLALQRGQGQGAYSGRIADAVRGAMQNMYQQRINRGNPRQNFLNWYLDQVNQSA